MMNLVSLASDTITGAIVSAPGPRKTAGNIDDNFSRFNSRTWHKANGWTNGNPFNNGWRSDKVFYRNGKMHLRLDNRGCPGRCSRKPYVSGELRSNKSYKYGLLRSRIKSAKASGTTTTLFFYTGKWGKPSHHEIDIEIFGKNPRKMQLNYYAFGAGKHEKIINLGFDSSKGFHTYSMRWAKKMLIWYVDGKSVHCVTGTPKTLPSKPAKIMMNLWPGTGVNAWLGAFQYLKPVTAQYDWLKYTPASGLRKPPAKCPVKGSRITP
ncbi:MAG: family 16 glycosylhydrolase [Candidatus Margulisiibacteriota bacterium]|nr:family 16 glycosylhydrolase [Candidatus Margulisiibacteriota bacterium]